ncbi:HET-domain-containing protein [Mollisia scopiformis]|uniref:HET-domain-containing protein n=1 Tax=Mollisia scopiformis TaxID=149040 RepID=A0A194WY04_MOLSC|nr:HET-domain-containing protein [Mollisia scopiformis]KUJ12856.1 HET-domain-containing protein [Mollisia scopiformis]
MRLINTETMKMEEFFNENVPPYAILSHRWGAEEVSLQEWNRIQAIETKMDTLLQKAGFAKIISFIEATKQVRYVWADTCCIDKTNNAELSEAINSMFRWYQEAEICYVYLADVPTGLTESELEEHICASKWFERGWTFQELLAPHVVMFYDQRWDFLFEKRDRCSLLSRITRIHDTFLSESRRIGEACTAMKMSWAATRTTTRDEDLAYCLLGIFDVSMPPLYGEGKKAFVRLQEEILRHSGDLSIFAWGLLTLLYY